MSGETEFLKALERFGQEILQRHPRLADTLKMVRAGKKAPQEAIKEVWAVAARDSDLHETLESALFDAFQIDPTSTDLAHFPDRQRMLERWGFEEEDLVFEPFEDRPDYKMLHPLLMGMIVELLQFDGDVPELRTGPIPEGGSPAVPVKTQARDPVLVGALLRTASQEVAGELASAQEEHDKKTAKMVEALGGTGNGAAALIRQETQRGVGVPGYVPGKKAELREVSGPSSLAVASLSFAEKQELAHKALTSTQGRRSVVPLIEEMVKSFLNSEGYLSVRSASKGDLLAEAEWSIWIDGGQAERNPRFNFIDIAARAIGSKLKEALAGQASRYTSLFLEVSPINEVSERRVGWKACLRL